MKSLPDQKKLLSFCGILHCNSALLSVSCIFHPAPFFSVSGIVFSAFAHFPQIVRLLFDFLYSLSSPRSLSDSRTLSSIYLARPPASCISTSFYAWELSFNSFAIMVRFDLSFSTFSHSFWYWGHFGPKLWDKNFPKTERSSPDQPILYFNMTSTFSIPSHPLPSHIFRRQRFRLKSSSLISRRQPRRRTFFVQWLQNSTRKIAPAKYYAEMIDLRRAEMQRETLKIKTHQLKIARFALTASPVRYFVEAIFSCHVWEMSEGAREHGNLGESRRLSASMAAK